MNRSQRRAYAALGLGPSWRLRARDEGGAARASASAARIAARRLFALSSDDGRWLFVGGASSSGIADDEAGARGADAMRLLERMLAALGLQAASEAASVDVAPDVPTGRDAPAGWLDALAPGAGAPHVVVALGEPAAQALLGSDAPLSSLRGQVHEARVAGRAIPLVASEHPSQLLASPSGKAAAWADLCLARRAHDSQCLLCPISATESNTR